MNLQLPNRKISWPRRGCVMAILNINDDSFSDDGSLDPDWAVERALELIAQGADIIDVGAESARTNREAIPTQTEIARLQQFCAAWPGIVAQATPRDSSQIWPPILSLNTWRSEVVAAALAMGAELINDMSGLPDDHNARLCADAGAALLLMHSVGAPKVSHRHIKWEDVVTSMVEFFQDKIVLSQTAGLPLESIIIDPGFGFAKSATDDLTVLRELARLKEFGRPILLPVGRKGFIGEALSLENPQERDAGTLASVAVGYHNGGAIFRVHDASGCFEALKVLSAVTP